MHQFDRRVRGIIPHCAAPDDFAQRPFGSSGVPEGEQHDANVVQGSQLSPLLIVQLERAPRVHEGRVGRPTMLQHSSKVVLSGRFGGSVSLLPRVRGHLGEASLRLRQVAPPKQGHGAADLAEHL